MNPGWLHRNRTLLPFFIALTALIVLNGASWWAYRIASSELRDNFRRNVTSLSEFLARQVEIAYQEDLEKNLLFLENSL
ncbi:MAG: hypothetical protein KC917_07585, partial [Candidatus Omnitrophica bacterium]|nr:hypothetical protein [Candidatus Omnitrophota bacterium]